MGPPATPAWTADRQANSGAPRCDHAKLRYFGERNEAAPYLADRGWALTGISIRDLFAANDLAPLDDDDLRMGNVLYVSGALNVVHGRG